MQEREEHPRFRKEGTEVKLNDAEAAKSEFPKSDEKEVDAMYKRGQEDKKQFTDISRNSGKSSSKVYITESESFSTNQGVRIVKKNTIKEKAGLG